MQFYLVFLTVPCARNGGDWVQWQSEKDMRINNAIYKTESYVIGRQNVYFQYYKNLPMLLFNNSWLNPYPYYNFNFIR